VKTDETRKLLDQVATALEKYWQKNGALPEFKDFVSLSDLLSPSFMSSLIRVDSWHHPLAAFKNGANSVRLVSPGPDGQLGTGDRDGARAGTGPAPTVGRVGALE